jgi:hypothetical protein
MGEEAPKPPAAGGWVITTKLRSDLNADHLVQLPVLKATMMTWSGMRELRKEPELPFDLMVKKVEGDPNVPVRIFGNSNLPFEETTKQLGELSAILLIILEQKGVEFFVAGKSFVRVRTNQLQRPPNVTIN